MTRQTREKRAHLEPVACEPVDVAAWINLADASLLGTEPISLPTTTVARLKQYGSRVELTPTEAGAILRVRAGSVHKMTNPKDPNVGVRGVLLGSRRDASGRVLVTAVDLVAYIERLAQPPVPTTGARTRSDAERGRKAEADVRLRHKLPRS